MVPNNGLAERQNKIKLTNVASRLLVNAFEEEPVFQLAAKGVNLSFQWQIKTGDTWNDLPACIFPYLNFSEIPTSLDQSVFRCKVYNEAGTVYSDEVTLTVNKPTAAPVIEIQPSDANVDPVTPSVALDDVYANVVINAGSGGGGGGGEATIFIGISSTKITDGGNELPTIDGAEVTPETGNIVIYKDTEFIYANTKWYKFGDAGVYLLSGAEAVEDKDIANEAISQVKIKGLTDDITSINGKITANTENIATNTANITKLETNLSNVSLTATDAKTAANNASTAATEAKEEAATATTKAEAAETSATTAVTTANAASEKSITALDTADKAKETAETALTNATAATTTAESALTKANTNASAITDINTELAKKATAATTLEGYGITDAYTKTAVDTELEKKATTEALTTGLAAKVDTTTFNTELTKKANTATTLKGYNIADAYTSEEVDAELAKKADKATTLAGYSITDAYTKTEVNTELAKKATTEALTTGLAIKVDTTTFNTELAKKADKATTLAGYSITDAYTKTELDGKLVGAMRFKGNVDTYDDLPSTGQSHGDMWNVLDTGDNYAWNSDTNVWDNLAGIINLADYAKTTDVNTSIATAVSNHDSSSSAHSTLFDGKADKAATLAGYGITDAYTSDKVDTELAKKATTEALTTGLAAKVDTTTFDTEIEAIKNKVYTKSYVNEADITSTAMEDSKYVFEIPFTHSFNTKDLSVNVYYNDARIITDVVLTDMNTVTIRMLVASNTIAANTLRIVVQR